MTTYYLITFASTHLAIKAERTLKEQHRLTMIPTPRELSASCGLSLMLEAETAEAAFEKLKEEGTEGMALYRVTRMGDGPRQYESLNWGA